MYHRSDVVCVCVWCGLLLVGGDICDIYILIVSVWGGHICDTHTHTHTHIYVYILIVAPAAPKIPTASSKRIFASALAGARG